VAPWPETIYAAVYAGAVDVKATEYLRSRRPRRRGRQARHANRRPALANIARRPEAVTDRSEVGHWEIDQIIGARNRSSLLTFTERQTRWAMAITMPEGYDAPATLAGLVVGCGSETAHDPWNQPARSPTRSSRRSRISKFIGPATSTSSPRCQVPIRVTTSTPQPPWLLRRRHPHRGYQGLPGRRSRTDGCGRARPG